MDKLLAEVVEYIIDKYINNVTLIVEKDIIVLEYMYYIHNEQDVYKTIEFSVFDNKLIMKLHPEKISRIIELDYLDYLFETLKRHCQNIKFSPAEINHIKDKYKSGSKIKLIKMYDYINAVEPNSVGVVQYVDDIGTIHMLWENKSTQGLVVGVDEFEIIN